MEQDKEADRAEAFSLIIKHLLQLIIPVSILVFWFGGSTTRAWMLGFVWGLFGVAGQPPIHPVPAASGDRPPLTLLGHGCQHEYGYQICEGEIRNDTKEPLEDVMAEVRFVDKAGIFIKAGSSMIDYQPLMPGQTSPFKVMVSDNPQIRHFTMGFRQMFGSELKVTR